MLYDAEFNDWYVAVEQLKQQLKEAENVIVGLSNYYDLNSNAWSESEYKFLLDAKEYIDKYKGDS